MYTALGVSEKQKKKIECRGTCKFGRSRFFPSPTPRYRHKKNHPYDRFRNSFFSQSSIKTGRFRKEHKFK